MLVAVATPSVGVVKVGEVPRTIAPVPVTVVALVPKSESVLPAACVAVLPLAKVAAAPLGTRRVPETLGSVRDHGR